MNLDLQKVLPTEAFETEQNEGDYIGKDGLLYCGVCRTKKQTRLPASDFTGGREIIVPCICKCKVEENKRKEEEEKKRQEMQRLERLKASSLMDAKLKAARLDGYQVDGDNQKIYNLAGNYVKRFDEMYEKRQGLLFWGTVGTGKSYTAACIANELLDQMIPVVMTSFVKILQNIQGNPDEEERIMAGLNAAKLLIIDDLGAERSTDYENLVKLFYNEAAKGKMFPEGAMLDVRIIAYYEIPKSTSKKKHREMLEHRIRPTKKPDWDNIGKIVCDSLNLVAYHDDSAVVDAQVRKFYSETPRVDVMIKVVGPDQI